jgi:hypothetical protein
MDKSSLLHTHTHASNWIFSILMWNLFMHYAMRDNRNLLNSDFRHLCMCVTSFTHSHTHTHSHFTLSLFIIKRHLNLFFPLFSLFFCCCFAELFPEIQKNGFYARYDVCVCVLRGIANVLCIM